MTRRTGAGAAALSAHACVPALSYKKGGREERDATLGDRPQDLLVVVPRLRQGGVAAGGEDVLAGRGMGGYGAGGERIARADWRMLARSRPKTASSAKTKTHA